jgi:hypothetical protein
MCHDLLWSGLDLSRKSMTGKANDAEFKNNGVG